MTEIRISSLSTITNRIRIERKIERLRERRAEMYQCLHNSFFLDPFTKSFLEQGIEDKTVRIIYWENELCKTY